MSQPNSPPMSPRKGKQMTIKVIMLDDTVHNFLIPQKAYGQYLFDEVLTKLNILEADYFGLEYTDQHGTLWWLDYEKPILKQVSAPYGLTFNFCVKFYTPDPGLLEEEYTRYLFALQVRRDLLSGNMPCNENTGALLASFIIQAELGDFIEEEYPDHTYISSFKLIHNQTEELELKIMDHHRMHIGQTPAEADFNLLDTARKVEMYGIKVHNAKDHEGVPLNLAVAHMGVLVFQNYTKINTFSWAKIRKLSFKRKKFLIKLHPEGYGYYKDTVEFYFETRNECKNFWKKCIEHHAFFRCQAVKRLARNKKRVVSKGSSFRYSGRTQKQLVEYVRENYVKRPQFERKKRLKYKTKSTSMRTMSASRTPNTSTLNSRDFMMGHNTSTSSGSHILENAGTPKDTSRRGERVETAEVHDGSSQSGKSLGSPKKEHNYGDERLNHEGDREREEELDHVDTSGYSYSKINYDLTNEPADQNANDNDDNISHDSYHLHDERSDEFALDDDVPSDSVKPRNDQNPDGQNVFDVEDVEGGPPSYEFSTERVSEETKHDDVLTNEIQMSEVVNGNLEISKFRDTIEVTTVERRVDTYKVQATVVKERVTEKSQGEEGEGAEEIKEGDEGGDEGQKEEEENVRVERVVIMPGEKLDTQAVVQQVLKRVMESDKREQEKTTSATTTATTTTTSGTSATGSSDSVTGAANGNDIQYILHRRCAEATQTDNTDTGMKPPTQLSTFRTSPKMAQRSQKPSPLGKLDVSPLSSPVSGERSPSRSPAGDRSPGMGRSFEFIKKSKLPPRDSYSSADDSLSPSLEKEIFEHIRLKHETDARLRSASSGSEETSEKKRIPSVEGAEEVKGEKIDESAKEKAADSVFSSVSVTTTTTTAETQQTPAEDAEQERKPSVTSEEQNSRTKTAVCVDSIPLQVLITCPSSESLPSKADQSPVVESVMDTSQSAVMVSSSSSLAESLEEQLQSVPAVTSSAAMEYSNEDFVDHEIDRVCTPESMSDDLAQTNIRSESPSSLTSSESGVALHMTYQITCPPELQPNESLDRIASTRSSSQSSLEMPPSVNTQPVLPAQVKTTTGFSAANHPYDSPSQIVPVPPLQICDDSDDEDDATQIPSVLISDTVLHISTSESESEEPAPVSFVKPSSPRVLFRQDTLPEEVVERPEHQTVTFSTFKPASLSPSPDGMKTLSPTLESDSDIDCGTPVVVREDDVNKILSDQDAMVESRSESESEELPPPPPPEELELEMVAESVLESVFEQVREVQMAQAKAQLLQEAASMSPASSISSEGGKMLPPAEDLADAVQAIDSEHTTSSYGAASSTSAAISEEQRESIERYFAQYQSMDEEPLPPPPPPPPQMLDYESIPDDDQSESSISEALGFEEGIDSEDMLEPLERLNRPFKGHADSDTESSSDSEGSEDLEIAEPVVIQRQISRHKIGIEVKTPKRSEFKVDVPQHAHVFENPSAQVFDNEGQVFSNPYAQFSPDRPDLTFNPETSHVTQGAEPNNVQKDAAAEASRESGH